MKSKRDLVVAVAVPALTIWLIAGFVQSMALLTHGYEPQWYTPILLAPLYVLLCMAAALTWFIELFK